MLNKLFGKKTTASNTATVTPHDTVIEVEKGEVLLDALLRNQLDVPYSCQAGSCGECKCKLVSGNVRELLDSAYVLEQSEIQQGYVLACQSVLKGPITIHYNEE